MRFVPTVRDRKQRVQSTYYRRRSASHAMVTSQYPYFFFNLESLLRFLRFSRLFLPMTYSRVCTMQQVRHVNLLDSAYRTRPAPTPYNNNYCTSRENYRLTSLQFGKSITSFTSSIVDTTHLELMLSVKKEHN